MTDPGVIPRNAIVRTVTHPYVVFRVRLARHALRQFAASLRSGAEIVLLVFGPVLIGLLALVALPPMHAASLPLLHALPLLLAHALAMTLPMWLLRKRMLPQDVARWLHPLPVPRRLELTADALVAGMLAGPLALAYALSAAIWLVQRPGWLQPGSAIAAIVFSWLATWACASAILARRSRRPAPVARWQRRLPAAPARYTLRSLHPRALLLWHRLFWLPFWRAENMVGRQQTVLLLGALAAALGWMTVPPGIPRGVLGLCTSALLVLLTDRGDKAVREQAGLLRPVMAAWPVPGRTVALWARAFSLAPALLVLALLLAAGTTHGAWERGAGRIYLALAFVVQLLLVTIPGFNARGRVGLVVGSIVALTAVGSEIWN